MEDKRKIRYRGDVYNVMIFTIDGEIYWRATGYRFKESGVAAVLQEICGFPIDEYGFSDFGVIDRTAYWESREQSTNKEQ